MSVLKSINAIVVDPGPCAYEANDFTECKNPGFILLNTSFREKYTEINLAHISDLTSGMKSKKVRNVAVGKLRTEEGIDNICSELFNSDCRELLVVSFEADALASQQFQVYEELKSRGIPLERIVINGAVPAVDNIDLLSKLAVDCRAVLLHGFFNRWVLSSFAFEEMIVTIKYLLKNKADKYSIVFKDSFEAVKFTPDVILKQRAAIISGLKKLDVEEEMIEGLFDNTWLIR